MFFWLDAMTGKMDDKKWVNQQNANSISEQFHEWIE